MKSYHYISLALAAMLLVNSCDYNPFETSEPETGQTDGNDKNDADGDQKDEDQNTDDQIKPDFSDQDYYKVNYWKRTSAQKMGLRGPVKSWYKTMNGSKLNGYSLYQYDKAGNLIRETYFQDLVESYEITYKYDSQNRVTERNSGTLVTTFQYDNGDRMVASNYWSIYANNNDDIRVGLSAMIEVDDQGDHEQRAEWLYSFDENGNLQICIHRYPCDYEGNLIGNWEDRDTIYIEYKDGMPYSGGPIKGTEYYPNGMIKQVVTKSFETYYGTVTEGTYTYIESDRVWEPASYDAGGFPDRDPYGSHYWSIYSYNEYDDLTAVKSAYWSIDTEYNNTYDRYKYDQYGNWIERNETTEPIFQHGEHFGHIAGRVIEYYTE